MILSHATRSSAFTRGVIGGITNANTDSIFRQPGRHYEQRNPSLRNESMDHIVTALPQPPSYSGTGLAFGEPDDRLQRVMTAVGEARACSMN